MIMDSMSGNTLEGYTLLLDARLLPVMNVHQKVEFVLPWNANVFAFTCTNVTTNAIL